MSKNLLEKTEEKVVLLLTPEEISRCQTVLQSLHILKSAKGISYEQKLLTGPELKKYYASLQEGAMACLLQFREEVILDLRQDISQKFKMQKAGISSQAFMKNALHRHYYKQFQGLKPFYQGLKIYHRVKKGENNRLQTLPCRIRDERPELRFEVNRNENGYFLQTGVWIGDCRYDLSQFNRFAFLLENNNEYFLLSFPDYQTLEWLAEEKTLQYFNDSSNFQEHVLVRLESSYRVNRNHLFDEKKIVASPANRVMFNELNKAFLMLTPQWLYDGILVEGQWEEFHKCTLNGERVLITRDRDAESIFLEQLVSMHPNFSSQRNGYYYLPFAEAQKKQWFVKTYHKLLDMGIEVVGMDLLQHFKYSPHKVQTSVAVSKEEGSQVHLDLTVSFGKEEVSLSVLQKALYAGQKAIVLKDGSLGSLDEEWLKQYGTLIRHGRIGGKEIQVSRFMALGENKAEGNKPVLQNLIREEWWQRWQQWQGRDEPLYPVPESIKAKLRPYQQKGFEWLALLSEVGAGACLADDMGLGKTLQTICFLDWFSKKDQAAQHIIVCPTSLLYNWQQEIKKFAPELSVEVCYGTNQTMDSGAKVLITSYGFLRNHIEEFQAKQFGVAVIDESHNIKNPSALITRAATDIRAAMRIALSGTPVVNNTFDLYAQLNFALPGLFGSREFFKREYADAIDRYGDEEKIKSLQRMTAPFILRRTKQQVATDLPDKTETVIWCTMSSEQESLYNEIRDQIRGNLFSGIQSEGLNKIRFSVLQGLLKLRQICNDPKLLSADEHGGVNQSIKTEILLEELSNIGREHKVLIFSQFSSMLHILADTCRQKGMAYHLLDGQTPSDKRIRMVNDFQENNEGPRLFFISLKAGNTGLTLTAADYVFLFDPWWNTAVEQQAVDRTHRIGQTKNVFSYKLICRNTIEEKILELQARKKQLAEELISGEEGFVKALSEEDIRYLFS